MLVLGFLNPLETPWIYRNKEVVDLKPWRYVIPLSITLFSAIVFLYLLFSPLGVVNGFSGLFWTLVSVLILINVFIWLVKVFDLNVGLKF